MDPHSNLSFLGICYVFFTAPKMSLTSSFVGCATLHSVFCGMGLMECFLWQPWQTTSVLPSAAHCSTALLPHTLCLKMVTGAYVGGFLSSFIETYSVYQHDSCGPNMINHFFCDLPSVLVLSCSDSFTSQVVSFTVGVVASVLVILISYGYIVATDLKISSAKGKTKAFCSWASHLTAVTFFYSSGLFTYLRL